MDLVPASNWASRLWARTSPDRAIRQMARSLTIQIFTPHPELPSRSPYRFDPGCGSVRGAILPPVSESLIRLPIVGIPTLRLPNDFADLIRPLF